MLPLVARIGLDDKVGNEDAAMGVDTLRLTIGLPTLLNPATDMQKLKATLQHELAHGKEWLTIYKEQCEVQRGTRAEAATLCARLRAAQGAEDPEAVLYSYEQSKYVYWADEIPTDLRMLLAPKHGGEMPLTDDEKDHLLRERQETPNRIRDGYTQPYGAVVFPLQYVLGGRARLPMGFRLEEITTLVDTYYEDPERCALEIYGAQASPGVWQYPKLRMKMDILREYGFLPRG